MQAQRAGGIDAVLMAGHRDHHRLRSGGDDHVLALILLAVAGHDPVRLQLGGAGHQLHTVLLHQELDAAHQLAGDLALALLDLAEAEAARIPEDAAVHQGADLLHGDSLVHQIFGGDTAYVQAGATHMLLLEQGDLASALGGIDGQGVTARAAADD